MSKFLSGFMNYDSEWGSYSLTQRGTYTLVIAIVLCLLVVAFVVDRKQKSAKFSSRQLVFCGAALALAFLTSYIKYELPFGGSVTLLSMLFICLIGNWYGIKVGLFTAFAYSILQFMQTGGTYFLTPFQVCCDYFFAFTALGLTGFFIKKKHGLLIGYCVAVFVRGIFHTLGGYIFWMDYMPESFPSSIAFLYPVVYNYSYLLIEGIITISILSLPPVKTALERIRQVALEGAN